MDEAGSVDLEATDGDAEGTDDAVDDIDDADATTGPASDPEVDRSEGPFDDAEVDDEVMRLDLGSLRVPGVEGMELRLEIDQQAQQVVAATAVIGESALQLQAFAAPRTRRIWREIRDEIADSIEEQGGTVELHDGDLGAELHTRMPSAGPDGRTVFAPARFVGVDGPRWFLRGVISGRAAIDPAAAKELTDILRGTVVVRGSEPMAPRELLPLALPADGSEAGAEPDGGDGEGGPDLNPFERGPEITEVR